MPWAYSNKTNMATLFQQITSGISHRIDYWTLYRFSLHVMIPLTTTLLLSPHVPLSKYVRTIGSWVNLHGLLLFGSDSLTHNPRRISFKKEIQLATQKSLGDIANNLLGLSAIMSMVTYSVIVEARSLH